ncbi:MAG TPA: HD domain-containing protein [Fimbriimonadaceae bacterium]|nr:HD domain-containing protein [Fimbriimonadaceae bacterium]
MEPALSVTPKPVSIKDVRSNGKIKKLIDGANEVMKAMGYTEHGQRHAGVVSSITRYILESVGVAGRDVELGQIAGFMHDIGNVVNRIDHPLHGAAISFTLLDQMGMDAAEIAPILGAIGNHEEMVGLPVSPMSAALIIADKSDVHFSRVQNPILETFDIHDRVNYAVQKSRVEVRPPGVEHGQTIELTLEIDTSHATVMEYFEIFLNRMVMCRKSADLLGYKFTLNVNGTYLE